MCHGTPGAPLRFAQLGAGATADGTVNNLHNTLRGQVRQAAGRDPQPTAAIIDSQSVRAAETVARSSRGYDAGKKVNGRKRHIAVNTTISIIAAWRTRSDSTTPVICRAAASRLAARVRGDRAMPVATGDRLRSAR